MNGPHAGQDAGQDKASFALKAGMRILAAAALGVAMAPPLAAQSRDDKPMAKGDPSGTVVLDGVAVPISGLLSEEGAAYLRHLIVDKPFAGGFADIKAERARQDKIMFGFLEPMRKRYKVDIAEQRIGGIITDVVTPAGGIAPENRDRILINLHGGGFTTGARSASLVESVPLAALMKIKIVSIDYRMGPEHAFPAGSQDVATVYRELLKTYHPSRIGLYGCSAGGMLTAESIAWFQTHDLPNPAAIGVFCASLGKLASGDSAILSGPLNGMRMMPPPPPKAGGDPAPRGPGYFNDVKDDDPLAYPQVSPAMLAKFPPTLFITGTRSFEFSAALNSHNKLTQAGGESYFHGWDGMFHGFIYNSEMPESREAYDLMVTFFNSHLAK